MANEIRIRVYEAGAGTPLASALVNRGASFSIPTPSGTLSIGSHNIEVTAQDEALGYSESSRVVAGSIDVQAPAGSYGVFPVPRPSAVTPNNNDGQPITVGMRFYSSQIGNVLGIHFLAPTTATGVFTACLFDYSGGALIASKVATGVVAGAWNYVAFDAPQAIGIVGQYTAALHSSEGRYASTPTYWTVDRTNGVLTAPSDAPQALYDYGATPTPPNNEYQEEQYWVDVEFQPT